MKNVVEVKFKAVPENNAFARNLVALFIVPLNPSIEELNDIKTAVSEAVSNVIVHAYPENVGYITMKMSTKQNNLSISITDNGIGITDIDRALTPFYTTKPDQERSGMGFTIMRSFMDELEVKNGKGGLTVLMSKQINSAMVV